MANVSTETFPGEKELQELIERVKRAQIIYASYSQEQVDKIFRAAAIAANNARISLAQDAVQETGMGIIEDKVIKNHFAAEYIFHKYKDEKTCGIIEEDTGFGIEKIAEPKGVICGIIPTTNPTSTAIFKSLISLKTRNAIIFSPHPRAKKCTCDAARIVRDAAVAAGAPEDIIAWIDEPTMEKTNFLMHHPLVNLILATGGPGMVKSAYSSGKPAIGVGAGNTPALIDKSANIKMAVSSILMSKTFDNGVVCASEQSVIVNQEIYDAVKKEFKARGAHFLTKDEMSKLEPIILDPQRGTVNPKIVGQSAANQGGGARVVRLHNFNDGRAGRFLRRLYLEPYRRAVFHRREFGVIAFRIGEIVQLVFKIRVNFIISRLLSVAGVERHVGRNRRIEIVRRSVFRRRPVRKRVFRALRLVFRRHFLFRRRHFSAVQHFLRVYRLSVRHERHCVSFSVVVHFEH